MPSCVYDTFRVATHTCDLLVPFCVSLGFLDDKADMPSPRMSHATGSSIFNFDRTADDVQHSKGDKKSAKSRPKIDLLSPTFTDKV